MREVPLLPLLSVCLLATQPSVLAQVTLLDQFPGRWTQQTSVFGDGFMGSTFPGEKTPPTEIVRTANRAHFSTRMQVAQGPGGQAVFDEFSLSLSHAGAEDFTLAVESKTSLRVAQLTLVHDGKGKLTGTGPATVGGREVKLAATVDVSVPGEQKWDLEFSGDDGKPRWFRLTFKAIK